jgi:hypothetical protein
VNICQCRKINLHPVKSDGDSSPASISDTDDCVHQNGNFDHPNNSEGNFMAPVESDIEPGDAIENPDCQEQRDVGAPPTVPGFHLPT